MNRILICGIAKTYSAFLCPARGWYVGTRIPENGR